MTSISSDIANMTNATATENANSKKSGSTSILDQNAFLQLMITQLKNQDPTNPTDTNQMLTQEAAITQTGYLQNISKDMSTLNQAYTSQNPLLQASNLIGKEVTATDPNDSNSTISGAVASVQYDSDNNITLTVGNNTVPLSNVTGINYASAS
jgi:flagellar basal-body rod modification protein FlgD